MTTSTPQQMPLAQNIKMARIRVQMLRNARQPVSEQLLTLSSMDMDEAREHDALQAQKGLRSLTMLRAYNVEASRAIVELNQRTNEPSKQHHLILAAMDPDKVERDYQIQRNKEIAQEQIDLRMQDYEGLVHFLIDQGHPDAADIVELWFGL